MADVGQVGFLLDDVLSWCSWVYVPPRSDVLSWCSLVCVAANPFSFKSHISSLSLGYHKSVDHGFTNYIDISRASYSSCYGYRWVDSATYGGS